MVDKNDFKHDTEQGSPHNGEPARKKNKAQAVNKGNNEQLEAEARAQEITDNIDAEAEALDELAQALAEANDLRERHLRLMAEWDNYRKRTEAERAEERSRATERLVEKLLPALDDLERAMDYGSAANEESVEEGIANIYRKIQSVLESEGVMVIDPKGEPFDAYMHSAVSRAEDNTVPDETVLEVYQKGYKMGNRVIRPASVVVSCR